MITARQAQALYVRQAYTLEEVEERIRAKAATQSFTCLETQRVDKQLISVLVAHGFQVERTSTDVIVNW